MGKVLKSIKKYDTLCKLSTKFSEDFWEWGSDWGTCIKYMTYINTGSPASYRSGVGTFSI
jgi:hypothetical protein